MSYVSLTRLDTLMETAPVRGAGFFLLQGQCWHLRSNCRPEIWVTDAVKGKAGAEIERDAPA